MVWAALFALTPLAHGVILYWDGNNTTAGAGTTPTATWSTTGGANKKWTTNIAGTATTVNYTSGSDAVFSAASDATGSYTVTVSGTQNVSSILVEDGNPTFTSGTVNFNDASPALTINTGHTLNFNSALTSSNTGGLNLSGGGTVSLGSTTTLSGTLNLGVSGVSGTTLRLNAITLNLGTLNVTANSTIDFAGAASTLAVTNLTIAPGVTLTVTNWQNAVDFFSATNWAGVTPNTIGGSITNQVSFTGFTANTTGWTSAGEVRPMPEPSTYGLLLLGATGSFLGWRRWRQSQRA
ncbi:MAG: PEP-CTERM sorting domain-containing protein [Opitutae bacterium]|nr:PEP-CTERM sorting domain-containing protein [Opitutae bacterium]